MAQNLRALNKSLKSLDLGPEWSGLVELARSLARALDVDPCGDCKAAQDANIYREYRQTLKELALAGSGSDDGAADFLVSISTPRRAAVVDPEVA